MSATVTVPPGPTTLPVAASREAHRQLGRVLRPVWRGVALALLALLATVLCGLAIPPALGRLVDIAAAGGPGRALTTPLVVLTAATLAQGLLGALGDLLVVRVGERALAGLREDVLDRALSLPQADVERSGTGDLVSRVGNDVDRVSDALRSGLPAFISSTFAIVLTMLGLGILDWRFAVAGLVALPFYAWAGRLYTVAAPPLYAAERRAEGERSQQLVETLGGARTITALLLGPRHLRRVADHSEAARRAGIVAVDRTAWFFSRIHAAELTGTATVLVIGAVLVGNGSATLGQATAAALYFLRLFDPIGGLLNLLDEVQSATASLARLTGVLMLRPPARPGAAVPATPAVRLRGVSFGYDDGPEVLHDIDLDVGVGEHVALVGASGAGKTTLAALVAGIHDPRSGRLELGGSSVADLDRTVLARHVTLITQEVHVFAGPLAQDLRLARPDATDDALAAALDRVGATGWLRTLPDGLDTAVGGGGHPLTPVQAQQVALARLVLRDAEVAVLDEATAEAGSAGARVLEKSIRQVLAGRTALVVAHRLTTAADADRVVVLDHGRIVEQGPPAELSAGAGPYARLWDTWRAARSTDGSSPPDPDLRVVGPQL